MTPTNFEISKKLKEIGFNTPAEKCWAKIRLSKTQEFTLIPLTFDVFANCDEWFPSYDLETILDALPDFIIREYKSKVNWEVKAFREILKIDKYEIYYRCCNIETADDANRFYQEYGYMQEFSIYNFSNTGSLADTAGKMWLMLKEKGLVC